MSVTAANGFRAGGAACGIKTSGAPDLALVATDDGQPVVAAAVFTSNKATAAPVQVSRRHLEQAGGRASAVILNSGNANAATGSAGVDTAERTASATALAIGCEPVHVLVCSTGLIGIPLDAAPIEKAVPGLASDATSTAEGGLAAATAIMTTDTKAKQTLVAAAGFTIGGMAKGAAMLAPNMATMLAVLTTDATIDAGSLHTSLAAAVDGSFNRLSVDGCTSTNDTVIVLASGKAGAPDPQAFDEALAAACLDLAQQMVGDAEGATKVVRVEVGGAASTDDAARAARAVAESQLTKCSWYGQDPYWGRIVSDIGSSGVAFDLDRVSVAYGGTVVARDGVAADHDAAAVAAHMAGRHLTVTADLGLGDGASWVLTNDLTHAYVDENMGTS